MIIFFIKEFKKKFINNSNKLQMLEKLLEELIKNNFKAIIYS